MITKIKYDIEKLKIFSDEDLVGLINDKACELHFETFGESFNKAKPAPKYLFATWILDGMEWKVC